MDIEQIKRKFELDRFATLQTNIQIDDVEENRAVCSFKVDEYHLNVMNCVMGGAIFTLADFAFAVAANSLGKTVVSASATINYLKPAKCERIFAEAVCVKDGSKVSVYNVTITDENHSKIAIVTITGCVL